MHFTMFILIIILKIIIDHINQRLTDAKQT